MSNPRIKRIFQPSFTDAQMLSIDPVLGLGEVVHIRDESTGKIINYKVGDGVTVYSLLEFQSASTYPYTDPVTNPLGDLQSNEVLEGEAIADIIRDIVSPFQASVVSNVRNNASGTYQSTATIEIGRSINTAVVVTYSVSNQGNLDGATPIEIDDEDNLFAEANPYPLGSIALSPSAPIAPSSPASYRIGVRAKHTQGYSSYSYTTIQFLMRLLWGASNLADLTNSSEVLAAVANGGGSALKSSYVNQEYTISSPGYGYVLIPSALVGGNTPVWTDVTDPNAPASLQMVNLGTISVNNGVGTYNYVKFRTPFLNTSGGVYKSV